jgi:hypothetical protein
VGVVRKESDKPAEPVTLLLLGITTTAHDSLLSENWLTAVEKCMEINLGTL